MIVARSSWFAVGLLCACGPGLPTMTDSAAAGLYITDNPQLATCDAVAVRDSCTPVEWCILGDLGDACTNPDDCFIRSP